MSDLDSEQIVQNELRIFERYMDRETIQLLRLADLQISLEEVRDVKTLFGEDHQYTEVEQQIVDEISDHYQNEDTVDVDEESPLEFQKKKWWKVSVFGFAMIPVEFLFATVISDSAHVAAARIMGVDIEDVTIRPSERLEHGSQFGSVSFSGNLSPRQAAWIASAPMFVDASMLGAYGALVNADALPSNPYAQMGVFVLAAGHWFHLGTELFSPNQNTDTGRIESYLQEHAGLNRRQSRLIVRGGQSLVFAAGGIFLYQGFRNILESTSHPALDRLRARREERRTERERRRHGDLFDRLQLSITPDIGRGYSGLSLSGTF